VSRDEVCPEAEGAVELGERVSRCMKTGVERERRTTVNAAEGQRRRVNAEGQDEVEGE
jgi:hypothetical protein